MITRTLSRVLACAFLSGLFGAPLRADPYRPRIIEGTPASENDYPHVARLTVDGDLLCTGTLVGTRHILTAAHCFFDERNRRAVGDTEVVARLAGQQYSSVKVTIHPSYRARSSACVEGETDAAVVELGSDVPGLTPVALLDTPAPIGALLILAGYGTQGNGPDGEDGSIPPVGTINVGYTFLEGYGENPPQQNANSTYFYWTFENGEGNTASGDSGGPAFYVSGQQSYLAGITCGGGGNAEFGTDSFDTRVDLMAPWIRSITGDNPAGTAPGFSSFASPQGANIGAPFSFTVPVTGSLPITLNASALPAGLTLNGNTISGTPTAKGTTVVQLTASNAFGQAAAELSIVVTGFDPTVTMRRVLLQFDNAANSDFLDITGKITVGPKFNPRGKRVTVTIGRFSKQFRLNADGQSTGSGRSYFDLLGAFRGAVFKKQTVGFDLTLERVALAEELSTLGFPDSESAVEGQQVPLPLTVSINGVEASTTVILSFRERDLRWRIAP